MMNKPWAESCDQNREPILEVIRPLFSESGSILEIGSGTGQHAVFFAQQLPHMQWHASDQSDYHAGISMWVEEAALPNVHGPFQLDVMQEDWPQIDIDAVFSANSAHIMDEKMVEAMFAGVGEILPHAGVFALYGPFNYDGSYTSESNARFDEWLKSRDPHSGIKSFEWLNSLARAAGMKLQDDVAMPANNRILVWVKDAE
ncbi:DUF938 domain-containing protein [Solemya velum gill symbiont]|uniref:Methylase n=2 Tax=Solemya velum gill symbiont TaxID=2340 RepID=A0A0B0H8W2_SOVGS|nr:DUF938 domain-containing protein [Solemya velum gill symbiont]KHF24299.1 hypothetical protein JV46_27280 [Solemya velum gill symbiont]OOY57510.1 methylase [Solemya velum gill symbiont]OOY58534.1 methylase [Solemya velum gill symbiont]OOY61178.1 methylase [Solemya velum gill symbiont]OOY71156.1 methylase [Solemya velum gill symbiont]